MNNLIGLFGGEGASKSTSLKTVVATLEKRFPERKIAQTRMPGGTPMAEAIRDIHKGNWDTETVSSITELLMMFSSFEQLYRNVIEPSLSNQDIVVTDRLWACSYAYQVHPSEDKALHELFDSLYSTIVKRTPHKHMLFLDVDPAIGIKRARGRGELDRIEQQHISYFEKVRQGYLHLASKHENITVVDANQDIETVQNNVAHWANSISL